MNNILGQRIKNQRNAKGLTQKELAKLVSVQTNTVYKWEQGIINPSHETMKSLAVALNTTVAYLMGETDNPLPVGSVTKINDEHASIQKIHINSDNMSVGDGTAIGISAMGNVSALGNASARAYKNLRNFFIYEYAQDGKSLRLEIPKESTREEIEQIIKGAKCATFE